MEKSFDCLICGSCVADILIRPVPLKTAIGSGNLLRVNPLEVTTGGIVCNTGIAMARLGRSVAGFSYVGDDPWGQLIQKKLQQENVVTSHLSTHSTAITSTTAVLIDTDGERSLAHCVGATKLMNRNMFLENMDLFSRSRMMLIGYYSLMPNLEDDLPEILAAIRQLGCQTAMDTGGDGGNLKPLDKILPHLDVYVPSYTEASNQTGVSDPQAMIETFRQLGSPGLLGVKLGAAGALLSSASGQFFEIDPVRPPEPIIDTTGAGDCFYAGLLTGLLIGLDTKEAGLLAAATGACCITQAGATAGLRNYRQTSALAGLGIDTPPS